jgi:uncharacterized protein YpuA (DUF1002 family)
MIKTNRLMKTIDNKTVSPQQIKALHACFHKMGYDDDDRHDFITQFTNGRTSSSKELTFEEARRMLSALNQEHGKRIQEEAKLLCKQIFSLSFRISWLNKDYSNENREEFEMNKAKINIFCRQRTKFRKNLTAMTLPELKAVKKQLEAIARKEEQELNNKKK